MNIDFTIYHLVLYIIVALFVAANGIGYIHSIRWDKDKPWDFYSDEYKRGVWRKVVTYHVIAIVVALIWPLLFPFATVGVILYFGYSMVRDA